MGQDVLVFDVVGWWSGFNKGSDSIDDVDIGLRDIIEGTGTNNLVAPSHGASIGYFIVVVDGGDIA